jgi:PKD repeat protein/uncharacterized protein with GYD domain
LFLAVVALLIFTLSIGGAENPVIQFFGQKEDTVKQFLLRLVNGSFGILSVLLLILIATTLFFGFTRSKNELQKRSIAFLFAFVSLGLQFVTILVWLGMYNFVSAIEVKMEEKVKNIIIYLREEGEPKKITPEQLSEKYSPLDLIFSVEEIVADMPQASISFYAWDFNGDGVVDYETQDTRTEYRINRHGNKVVTVKIFLNNVESLDQRFLEKSVSFEIPKGTFQAFPKSGAIPLEVTFDASEISESYRSIISEYEWDFNNDNVFEESTPGPIIKYTFPKIGTYTVNLRTVNKNQTIQNYSTTITTTEKEQSPITPIVSTLPEMPLQSQERIPIYEGQQIQFNAKESWSKNGNVKDFEWFFSDTKMVVTGPIITHTFYRLGDWSVDLLLRDESGNELVKNIQVVVNRQPNAPRISLSTIPKMLYNKNAIEGKVPLTVSFDASESNDPDGDKLTFEWDFDGDGLIDARGEKVEHTFDIVGEYQVALTVKDTTSEKKEERVNINVLPHDLRAVIYADPESTQTPCVVMFDGSLSSCTDCKILAYEWDFGDGTKTNLTSAKVSHPFDQVGEYEVKLKVHTKDTVAETTKKILCLEKRADACFTATRLTGKAPLKSRFDPSCTVGTVENWSWDFGDGEMSQNQLPTHTFEYPGVYSVKLTIIDANRNIDTFATEIIVE